MRKVDGLSKRYKTDGEYVEALRGISFQLPERGLVFILGKSGSGKSTLLNILGGLDSVSSGQINIDGCLLNDLSERDLNQYRSREIGFVFQDFHLVSHLNVTQNIELSFSWKSRKDSQNKVSEVLKFVEMEKFGTRFPSELSGGEKQRVAIARAIVRNPKMILADEPTGNLDEETGNHIFELLKRLSRDRLVVIVTHDEEACSKYADRIIRLKDGTISEDRQISFEPTGGSLPERQNRLATPKMPFRITLSMAISNLKSRMVRSFLSILLFCLAIFSISSTMSVLLYKTETGIHLTLEKNQSRYVHFLASDLDRYGDRMVTHEFIPRTVSVSPYLKDIFQTLPSIENAIPSSGGMIYSVDNYGIVSSNTDLQDFGLNLYPGSLEISDDKIILSDLSVETMSHKMHLYDESGEDISTLYFILVDGEEFSFDTGTFSYQEIIGKEIRQYTNDGMLPEPVYERSFWISGIYETSYEDYLDQNLQWKWELSEDEIRNFNLLRKYVFKTYITRNYRNSIGSPPVFYSQMGNPIPKQLSIQDFVSRNFEVNVSYGSSSNSLLNQNIVMAKVDEIPAESSHVFVIGEQGFLTDFSSLGPNEVVVNLDAYNRLFDTSYQPSDLIHPSAILLEPQALGETVSFEVWDQELDTDVLSGNYRVVGVVVDEYLPYHPTVANPILYFGDATYDGLLDGYYSAVSALSVFIGNQYLNLETLLEYYAERGITPDFDYSFSFYPLDTGIRQANTFMLIMSAALFSLSALLTFNLVWISVASKKKEIGVLKALGYSTGTVARIFLYESLLIGFIVLIVSMALQPLIILVLNEVFAKGEISHLRFFKSEPIVYLTVLFISLTVPVIASLIPVRKISKLRPIECLRKTE